MIGAGKAYMKFCFFFGNFHGYFSWIFFCLLEESVLHEESYRDNFGFFLFGDFQSKNSNFYFFLIQFIQKDFITSVKVFAQFSESKSENNLDKIEENSDNSDNSVVEAATQRNKLQKVDKNFIRNQRI